MDDHTMPKPAPRPDPKALAEFFTPERIKAMRQASGLTQLDVALKVLRMGPSSQMTVWNWEKGRKDPNPKYLADLWAWYRRLVRAGRVPDEFGAVVREASERGGDDDESDTSAEPRAPEAILV
jgi:transcriptional regulator with XRE-family HTH domain